MNKKAFYATIYLYKQHAVASLRDMTIIETDPARLAGRYEAAGVDGILLFDMSKGDEEHEKAIASIRDICKAVKIPIWGAGNIRRFEDVKKLLYAGCRKAVLNFDRQDNIDIAVDATARFGIERIAGAMDSCEQDDERLPLMEGCVSAILLLNPHIVRLTVSQTQLPVMVHARGLALDKLLDIMDIDGVCGVTGNTVNDNISQIAALADLHKVDAAEPVIDTDLVESVMSGQEEAAPAAGVPMVPDTAGIDSVGAAVPWSAFVTDEMGLLPVVVQDYANGQVLMVAYMDEEAYNNTLATGKMCYHSRSRDSLWVKGDTSGHYQYVKSLTGDCDMDTLLARVEQVGAACHTGSRSCFFNPVWGMDKGASGDGERESAAEHDPTSVFEDVYAVINDRRVHPKEGSYTNYLFDKGIDKILKKLGEEATETVIAAKNPEISELVYETADLLYHLMVLMNERGVTWEDVIDELRRRES